MRGLLMAFIPLSFPGHAAGRDRARSGSAKSTAKTTTKTV
jgi:hypothetical protein